jgi:hypothetical protein
VLFRRIVRRTKGLFWSLWYLLLAPFKWIKFKRMMREHGLSEKYLWRAFTYLASLDMNDPMHAGDLEVYGCGMYLELKDSSRQFHATIQQVRRRQLVVQLWRPHKREVQLDLGVVSDTNWWEVYRSGRNVEPVELARVYLVLKQLYGDGEKDA